MAIMNPLYDMFVDVFDGCLFINPNLFILADPKKFMIETLEQLQKSQSTKRDYPCLFDDSNVQSVYGMLDPTNRGYITLKQYCEGNEEITTQSSNNGKFKGISCLNVFSMKVCIDLDLENQSFAIKTVIYFHKY